MTDSHRIDELITLFDQLFADSENTRLVAGAGEPLYLPAGQQHEHELLRDWHQVIFAHGFFASALHEISHWCIAGRERRQQLDYGYWYYPDGRNAEQQNAFEQVEDDPQALEWIFCQAAAFRFHLSIDNLSGVEVDKAAFASKVYQAVQRRLARGLGPRAQRFAQALSARYGGVDYLNPEHYQLEYLL